MQLHATTQIVFSMVNEFGAVDGIEY